MTSSHVFDDLSEATLSEHSLLSICSDAGMGIEYFVDLVTSGVIDKGSIEILLNPCTFVFSDDVCVNHRDEVLLDDSEQHTHVLPHCSRISKFCNDLFSHFDLVKSV